MADDCIDLDGLGEGERAVVRSISRSIAARLRLGEKLYGPLDVANYPRDPKKERAEEAADLLVYTAVGVLRGELDMLAQLTIVQGRCAELVEELRRLRAENRTLHDLVEALEPAGGRT
jgi:hypothetical protein